MEDIQHACDLFRSLYETTERGDGYVSIEVSPYLAHDTDKTVEQAIALWERVDRPNLMVKIPARDPCYSEGNCQRNQRQCDVDFCVGALFESHGCLSLRAGRSA